MQKRITANPSAGFPDQMDTWGDLKAVYRLWDAEKVDFGCTRQVEGAKPTGNGSGRGFLLHNALMVDAATMAILGLAGQAVHYRPEEPKSKKKTRLSR